MKTFKRTSSIIDKGLQAQICSLCFLLLNYNSITVPRPKINHTWLSEDRNQILLYKAEWPSLASLLRYEVPASEPSSPFSRSHHPSSPPDTHFWNSTTSKNTLRRGTVEGAGAQAGQLTGSHEVANSGAPGQGLVERGQSWAHSSQEGVTG